jgi:hypothetical protein
VGTLIHRSSGAKQLSRSCGPGPINRTSKQPILYIRHLNYWNRTWGDRVLYSCRLEVSQCLFNSKRPITAAARDRHSCTRPFAYDTFHDRDFVLSFCGEFLVFFDPLQMSQRVSPVMGFSQFTGCIGLVAGNPRQNAICQRLSLLLTSVWIKQG